MRPWLTHALGVVAAGLLLVAACTNHWLVRFEDMKLGLLGFRANAGAYWQWNSRFIEVARDMHEPVTRTTAFTVAGIVILVASCVASLAILVTSLRPARWSRWIALGAVVVAIVAVVVFLAAKPQLSGYLPSWSLHAFGVGTGAAIVWLRRTSAR
jgi:steroid 5-alpha reductase family enzyme